MLYRVKTRSGKGKEEGNVKRINKTVRGGDGIKQERKREKRMITGNVSKCIQDFLREKTKCVRGEGAWRGCGVGVGGGVASLF